MTKPALRYFEKEDVLHLLLGEGEEAASVELSPNLTAELDSRGELIGLEIVAASQYLRDAIVDTAQAKLLALGRPNQAVEPTG